MKCNICGSNGWINSVLMKNPDKYEKWMGITDVRRRWRKCLGCGTWHHLRNYPLEELDKIYSDGYRNAKFRGETIDEAFVRIVKIPNSENDARVNWVTESSVIGVPETLLDIGSGLGLFPFRMRQLGSEVFCVEYNKDSIKFMENMGMSCSDEIPDYAKFEAVSITHVLEHIENPVEFLKDLHVPLRSDGKLFIEVPDAIEFELLFPTHDDFNSCHTHFYDVPSLCKVLSRADYSVVDLHREHYKERNLHRIMATCRKN
jgi:SAM-dependent methyltransferase